MAEITTEKKKKKKIFVSPTNQQEIHDVTESIKAKQNFGF